jgi:3-deoxy-D-manno-octulosonic acid kinase
VSKLHASTVDREALDALPAIARAPAPAGAILFDHRRIAQADDALFDPGAYPQRQSEDARGGRGAVWFLRHDFGDAVLRHYRRGGLLGRFNRDRYLWTGEAASRSFREFRLLAELRRRDLPVPAPLAARYRRAGIWYRADILIALVPDARTLAQHVAQHDDDDGLWTRIGATLARFHREGVYHADLNAHNVLLDANDAVWLIDFDRGDLRPPGERWQQANLQRLHRSLHKLGGASSPAGARGWQRLLDGYRGLAANGEGTP